MNESELYESMVKDSLRTLHLGCNFIKFDKDDFYNLQEHKLFIEDDSEFLKVGSIDSKHVPKRVS